MTKLDRCKAVYKKWLLISDEDVLDILFAAALSLWLPGDRVWLFLIAPPGGTKTELLRALGGLPEAYSLSSLTAHSLISGISKKESYDLLPRLDGKLFIVKDFTVILSRPSVEQAEIFSQLRDAYDGYHAKFFGSGVGKKEYNASFVLIAGVTPVIEKLREVHQTLGERFLKLRIRHEETATIKRAWQLAGREDKMREELANATCEFFSWAQRRAGRFGDSARFEGPLTALAELTAKLRSTVERDHYHEVALLPEPEIGTRLAKQFRVLLRAIFSLYEQPEPERCLALIRRVAGDTVPPERLRVLRSIAHRNCSVSKQVQASVRLPRSTTERMLEDLWLLGLLDRAGEKPISWSLTRKTQELLGASKLLT